MSKRWLSLALGLLWLGVGALTLFPFLFLPQAKADLARGGERIVVDAMEYPWSTIGRVNAAGRAHCSGLLVSPSSVLTAAHCLYESRAGRWLTPQELHFLPGYQKDRYILHSKVKSYIRSHDFDPESATTARTAVTDWALLTLEKPLGRQAGWLALLSVTPRNVKQTVGDGQLLVSGYRAGAPYVQSLAPDCGKIEFFEEGAIAHRCHLQQGDSGSPLLLLKGGRFYAIGINVIGIQPADQASQSAIAGAFPLRLLQSKTGEKSYLRQVEMQKFWTKGALPDGSGPVRRDSTQTIAFLLHKIGYLPQKPWLARPEQIENALGAFLYKRGKTRQREEAKADFSAMIKVLGTLRSTLG